MSFPAKIYCLIPKFIGIERVFQIHTYAILKFTWIKVRKRIFFSIGAPTYINTINTIILTFSFKTVNWWDIWKLIRSAWTFTRWSACKMSVLFALTIDTLHKWFILQKWRSINTRPTYTFILTTQPLKGSYIFLGSHIILCINFGFRKFCFITLYCILWLKHTKLTITFFKMKADRHFFIVIITVINIINVIFILLVLMMMKLYVTITIIIIYF